MDDARIKQLTDEVMAQLARDPQSQSAAVGAPLLAVSVTVHASHQLLDLPSGSTDGRCVLEPGRPCVGSGQCRTLGH